MATVGNAFGANVATKDDVSSVRQAIQRLELRMESEFRSLRSDLRAMERRITLKFGGLMLAGLGLLFAALRFIP